MRIIAFLSIILTSLLAQAGSYDVREIVDKNPGITERFNFLKLPLIRNRFELFNTLNLQRKTTIAVIGDYIHTDTFEHIINVNTAEVPDNNVDDDKNGFVDDYLGLNMNTRDGRLKTPVITGHENGIVSLLDALIKDNQLENVIQILPINVTSDQRSFDVMYLKKVADGIDYAVLRGAKVISMSIGVSEQAKAFFEFIDKDTTKSLAYYEAAVQRAIRAGVILVASVSNDPDRDHSKEKIIPGHTKGVLSVANVNFDNDLQSAYGTNVDVAFYGTGLNVWNGEIQGYRKVKGSSFSTPLVSLTAAIAKSLKPELSSADIPVFRVACDGPIFGKKNIASKCVFSPEKFVMMSLQPDLKRPILSSNREQFFRRVQAQVIKQTCAAKTEEIYTEITKLELQGYYIRDLELKNEGNQICLEFVVSSP